jgi:hypothetical protein
VWNATEFAYFYFVSGEKVFYFCWDETLLTTGEHTKCVCLDFGLVECAGCLLPWDLVLITILRVVKFIIFL